MILGTHTSGQAGDQLLIAEVLLPKSAVDMAGKEVAELYDEERQGTLSPPGLLIEFSF